MKNIRSKRFLASFLAVLMLLSCFAVVSGAKGEVKGAKALERYRNLSASVLSSGSEATNKSDGFSSVIIGAFDLLDDEEQTVFDVNDYLVQYKLAKETIRYPDGTTETTTNKYDSAGRLIESSDVSKSILGRTTSSSKLTRSFDKKGNLTKETTVSDYGLLLGKEKTSDSYSYDKNGFVTKYVGSFNGDKAKRSYSYDKKGNLVSVKSDSSTTTNSYDKNGRLIRTVDISKDQKETTKEVTERSYDSKGNLTKISSSGSGADAFKEVTSFSYDKKGNVVKEKYIYEDEEYIEKNTETYTYDSKERLIKDVLIEIDEDGKKDKTVAAWTYDKKGRNTKYTYSSSWMKATATTEYDKNGNVVKYKMTMSMSLSSDSSKYTTIQVNTYDKKDRLVKTVYTSNSPDMKFKETTAYTYDSKDNLIKEEVAGSYSDGTKTKNSTEYQYDSNGNLVKMIENEKGDYGINLRTVTTYSYKKLSKKVVEINDISWGDIRISSYQYKYDGKAKKPAVFLEKFEKGVDYKVSYENNVRPGKAKAIVTFIGDYEDYEPITIYFNIKK